MSDLSLQLQQATSQLPVSSYFDAALYQREMATIFRHGPRYVGHQLSVPNVGDYHAPPTEGEGRALVRGRECGALVVLGSATPDLESLANARDGRYGLWELPERMGVPLPEVAIVDVRGAGPCSTSYCPGLVRPIVSSISFNL